MKSIATVLSIPSDQPRCKKFLDYVIERYEYLFQDYSAQIIHSEDYGKWDGCGLIVAIKDIQFRFEADRGYSVEVSPFKHDPSEVSCKWVAINTMLDFFQNCPPTYEGPGPTRDPRFSSRDAWDKSVKKLIDFYDSADYACRIAEFDEWERRYKSEFRLLVDEWWSKWHSSRKND